MQTAYDLVWLAAQRGPDCLALVDDASGRAFTYRELIAEVDAVAAGLAARGIGAGDRVATVLPSNLEHCLALLALQRLAAVPALVNARLKPDEIAQLVRDGEMQGAVAGAAAPLVAALADALPPGGPVWAVGGAVATAADFASCRGEAGDLPPTPKPDPEDPAFIFYTSGTTGLPKGVLLAHRTTFPRIAWLPPACGIVNGDHNRALGFMPLSHVIGFYCIFLSTLAFGGTYYVMSAFEPAKAVDLVEQHRITYLFAVPTVFFMMLGTPGYRPERMRSVELVLFGGAPMEASLLERMDREWENATMRHIYGLTEAMVSMHHPDPVGRPERLRPLCFAHQRVVAIGGGVHDVVGPGEEGEVIMDTFDMMFSGYLNRPDATAEKLRDGWCFTGDIAAVHAGGEIELKGRVDDMVRSGGESIHPEEVERVLAPHPGVAEVSVVGIPDSRWGQIVVACVVRGQPGTGVEDLDAHCRRSALASYKRPRAYHFVDTLPRNAANKVLRRVLRAAAEEARARDDPAFVAAGGA